MCPSAAYGLQNVIILTGHARVKKISSFPGIVYVFLDCKLDIIMAEGRL